MRRKAFRRGQPGRREESGRSAAQEAEKLPTIWRRNPHKRQFLTGPGRRTIFFVMKLEGIDHVAIAVPAMEPTIAWYREVLGLERLHAAEWNGVPAFVGAGSTAIAFFPDKDNAGQRGPMLHLAFRTDRAGFVRAQEELKKRGIAFHFEDHEIAHSIYFRDLNHLPLEITTYELEAGANAVARV
jgi:catechol 2,3-dioxygenase-like lactoylglutathione lyase family enzyme